jgi:hypothetical protein
MTQQGRPYRHRESVLVSLALLMACAERSPPAQVTGDGASSGAAGASGQGGSTGGTAGSGGEGAAVALRAVRLVTPASAAAVALDDGCRYGRAGARTVCDATDRGLDRDLRHDTAMRGQPRRRRFARGVGRHDCRDRLFLLRHAFHLHKMAGPGMLQVERIVYGRDLQHPSDFRPKDEPHRPLPRTGM